MPSGRRHSRSRPRRRKSLSSGSSRGRRTKKAGPVGPAFFLLWSERRRRPDGAAAFAEADRDMAVAGAAPAHDDVVSVLDEHAAFAARQLYRRLAALGQLEDAADRVRLWPGDRAAAQEVARAQI